MILSEKAAGYVLRNHARGGCPCCGLPVGDDDEEAAPGIRFCGICVGRGHHEDALGAEMVALIRAGP